MTETRPDPTHVTWTEYNINQSHLRKISKTKIIGPVGYQRVCKNVASPDEVVFASLRCLSLLRASMSCKPALCLGRDFLGLVWSWGCGLAGAGGEGKE